MGSMKRVFGIGGLTGRSVWVGFALVSVAWGQGADSEGSPDFVQEVMPILSEKCFSCHGPDAEKNQLKLTSFEEATRNRDGVWAIDPSRLESSEILLRIHDAQDPMPPKDASKPLSAREREVLSQWVWAGGIYQTHWAYRPPRRLEGSQTIDAFIGARLAEAGWSFAPEADRRILARRVGLALTGLPPQAAQLEAFVSSEGPGAYELLVDQLLASDGFGEHQARAWLDAVRYGDTAGLARDVRRGVYPYRDWVIEAMNDNLPFDQFITWQLAGDLLPEATLEQRVATGYVRMNPTTNEGGSLPEEFQAKNNFDRVENLGSVFLGMSLICARCHTHKYDAVTQQEYYRLLAFFNHTAETPLDGYRYDHPPVVRAPRDIGDWRAYQRLRARAVEQLSSEEACELFDIEERMTTSLVAREGKRRKTFLLHRGDYSQPRGQELEPGVIAAMGSLPAEAPRNRLGLARWLTAREHPLVGRVLVNRLWQGVFGAGIVRTPEDFGIRGQLPTHPGLLDYLALELHDLGWNLKAMLKQLVMSRTFRQSSRVRIELKDPENRLYGRGPRFRLDAEVIRDLSLSASGLLDPKMGGEGIKPYQPAGLWESIAHQKSNTRIYERDADQRMYRRSVYVYWKRASPHPMMTLFDAPSRESACVGRTRTETPLQSLALWNETLRVESARVLAERLIRETPGDLRRVNRLFELAVGRDANEAEMGACQTLLANMRELYARTPQEALQLVQVGDRMRDQALDAVEVAAWTQVSAMVLASDPAILLY